MKTTKQLWFLFLVPIVLYLASYSSAVFAVHFCVSLPEIGRPGWVITNVDSTNTTYTIPIPKVETSHDSNLTFAVVRDSLPTIHIHIGEPVLLHPGETAQIIVEDGDVGRWKETTLEVNTAIGTDDISIYTNGELSEALKMLFLSLEDKFLYLLKNGNYERVIQLLIEKQKDLKAERKVCQDLLYLAAELGYDKLIMVLHKLRLVDINEINPNGRTALHIAVINRHENIVTTLLNLGANPFVHDNEGQFPIHLSVVSDSHSSLGITKVLLKYGGSTLANQPDDKRDTPLHITANKGKLLQTRLLLKSGANRDAVNALGQKPVDLIPRDNIRLRWLLSQPFSDSSASDTDSEDESDYEYDGNITHLSGTHNLISGAHLVGQLNNEEIRFQEEWVSPDGNCGFTAIGTDREQLTTVLMTHADNIRVRESIWEEIAEAIVAEEFTPEGSKEILDLFMSTDYEKKAPLGLKEYCLSPEIFKAYLNKLRTSKMWLGYQTMLAFARAQNISVYIWHRVGNTGTLILNNYHQGTNPQVIHLLHTAGFTHFNLLVRNNGQYSDVTAPIVVKPTSARRFIAHYRGEHFLQNVFPRPIRRNMLSLYKLQQEKKLAQTGVFSKAAYELAGFPFIPEIDFNTQSLEDISSRLQDRELQLQKASSIVKSKLDKLQNTGPVDPILKALSSSSRKGKKYLSRYLEFIQCYVNTVETFTELLKGSETMSAESNRTRTLKTLLCGLTFHELPFISTSEEPDHPLKYSVALQLEGGGGALTPQYQPDGHPPDGHPRFPYLGIVYVALHASDELTSEKSSRIIELGAQKLIDINLSRRGAQKERTFIGDIDGQHICVVMIIRVPNFSHEYREYYLNKYGLNKEDYMYFKSKIFKFRDTKAVEKELIERIIRFKKNELLQIARTLADKSGGQLGFLGTESTGPILDAPSPLKNFTKK